MRLSFLLLAGLIGLSGCMRGSEAETRPVPEKTLTQAPQEATEPLLPDAVEDTKAQLIRHAKAGSLNGLTRIAQKNELFVSNFGDEAHRTYWDLMRRIGVDPNLKLRGLFDEPVGIRVIDGERWYVWPDLAARDPADLIPEKLTFQDRKHLLELVGEEGIEKVRAGGGYPGMRTAIAEDGRWVYFVLDDEAED
jgi:hypothetical protein